MNRFTELLSENGDPQRRWVILLTPLLMLVLALAHHIAEHVCHRGKVEGLHDSAGVEVFQARAVSGSFSISTDGVVIIHFSFVQ